MTSPITIAGTPVGAYHVCAFFNSRDEEYDALNPYYTQGVDNGERILHIVDPMSLDDHRARLEKAGIDTHQCEACGQLEVLTWPQAYLDEEGRFDKDRMLAEICSDLVYGGVEAGD